MRSASIVFFSCSSFVPFAARSDNLVVTITRIDQDQVLKKRNISILKKEKMKVVGLPSFPCLCVNIISVFFVLLNSKSIVADDDQLSVTSYGSFEIAMLRHGEKYATNRPCYKWEDVSPLYHGLTHVRGLNDKHGKVM